MNKIFQGFLFSCGLIILFFSLAFAQVENLTITTYYPSPNGVYNELRTKRLAAGTNYINNGVYCWEGNCTNAIAAKADLVVQNFTGMGTVNPVSRLHLMSNSNVAGQDQTLILQASDNFGVNATPNAAPTVDFLTYPGNSMGILGMAGWTGGWGDPATRAGDIVLNAYSDNSLFLEADKNVTLNSVNNMSLNTNNLARLFINQTGFVGIGTTAPRIAPDGSARVIRLDVANNIITADVFLSSPRYGAARWASEGSNLIINNANCDWVSPANLVCDSAPAWGAPTICPATKPYAVGSKARFKHCSGGENDIHYNEVYCCGQ